MGEGKRAFVWFMRKGQSRYIRKLFLFRNDSLSGYASHTMSCHCKQLMLKDKVKLEAIRNVNDIVLHFDIALFRCFRKG